MVSKDNLTLECEQCGKDKPREQDHWYSLIIEDSLYSFCSPECRNKWRNDSETDSK